MSDSNLSNEKPEEITPELIDKILEASEMNEDYSISHVKYHKDSSTAPTVTPQSANETKDDDEPAGNLIEPKMAADEIKTIDEDEVIDYEFLKEPVKKRTTAGDFLSNPSEGKDANSYFDDDEVFLSGDDAKIHDSDLISMFQQEDNVVSVEVLNLYTPEGNLRNRLSLRSDPPMLEIKSSSGESAQFILTKEFAKGLNDKTDQVYKGYFGLDAQSVKDRRKSTAEKLTMKDHLNNSVDWVQDNKGKTFIAVLLAAFLIYGLVAI